MRLTQKKDEYLRIEIPESRFVLGWHSRRYKNLQKRAQLLKSVTLMVFVRKSQSCFWMTG